MEFDVGKGSADGEEERRIILRGENRGQGAPTGIEERRMKLMRENRGQGAPMGIMEPISREAAHVC